MSSLPTTYALLGWPLDHSLSPVMHAAAFDALGIAARYVLRPTKPGDLTQAVDAVRAGELAGANVTVPHKIAVRGLLDVESARVTALGAVNTLVRDGGGVRGENTDVDGFRHALTVAGALQGRGKRAVVIGAGGAARAVVVVLTEAEYAVHVVNRSTKRLAALLADLDRAGVGAALTSGPLNAESLVAATERADLLVNATPVGAGPSAEARSGPPAGASPWPDDVAMPASLTVIDIVAWPPETRLVARARSAGANAYGGIDMLAGQAAAAFTLWTGRPAPLEAMRRAALAYNSRLPLPGHPPPKDRRCRSAS